MGWKNFFNSEMGGIVSNLAYGAFFVGAIVTLDSCGEKSSAHSSIQGYSLTRLGETNTAYHSSSAQAPTNSPERAERKDISGLVMPE